MMPDELDKLSKDTPDLDIDGLYAIASGFMAAKMLFAGCEIGLFAALADGPRTLDEIEAAINVPRRTLRQVADVMVRLRVLRRQGDRYQNTPIAQVHLTGRTPADLRPGYRFFDRIVYRAWQGFIPAVRTGRTPEMGHVWTPEEARIFSEGVEAFTAQGARNLVARYDFGPHRRIADLGGGTGSFLEMILGRFPHMRATLLELPEPLVVAREHLSRSPVRDRIDLVEGDMFFDELPQDHDVFLVSAIIHFNSPERNRTLFRRIREHVKPGARLLLVDLFVNPEKTDPYLATLLGGYFSLLSDEGDVYSVVEAQGWLEETGWKFCGHTPFDATSLVVGEAV